MNIEGARVSTCHVLEGIGNDGGVQTEVFFGDVSDTVSFAGEDGEGDDKKGDEVDRRHHGGRGGRRQVGWLKVL